MSFWDVLMAARRRWYVVLLGLVATLVALMAIEASPPVFYSRSQVVFLAPSSDLYPNKLRTSSVDLIITAGVVGKRVSGARSLPKTSSPDATMVGRGMREGVLISLPDHGGQWSPDFDTQALYVEVAAATPEEAVALHGDAVARIRAALEELQDDENVEQNQRITTEVAPATPTVQMMSGQPRRAQLITVLLGMVGTFLAVGLLELRARRRRIATGALDPADAESGQGSDTPQREVVTTGAAP